MIINTFLHYNDFTPTTLVEIKRIYNEVNPTFFLGAYAYATQSGACSFELAMGDNFWRQTASRWLFGIDYGRTQPRALRQIIEKPNTEVRIVDGAWLVNQRGFIPRRDFHAKLSLFLNSENDAAGMVVGSGNFSSNGLRKSIEAGATIQAFSAEEYRANLGGTHQYLHELWKLATPAATIVEEYETNWNSSFARRAAQGAFSLLNEAEVRDIFWIEAGYVTRNRGAHRPGNQIDFPRGITSRFFGFYTHNNIARNTLIGAVFLGTPGGIVQSNLRLGNNMMEKMSLPIPENHGFDIYDGKILLFHRVNGIFSMRALEAADFESAFGDRLDDVRSMGSGRRYGFIA